MPHGPQVPNTIYETTLSLPLSYGKKYLKIVFVGPAMGRVGQGTGALGGGSVTHGRVVAGHRDVLCQVPEKPVF